MRKTPALLLVLLTCVSSLHAQWVKTNGPLGIYIEALINKDSVLFAGTDPKGIYKSFDHGITWVESNSAATKNLEVTCFAYDSLYLYAGTLEDGVYRSPDNGVTWQPVNTGLQYQGISCLLVANGYLFAGTILNGIYRSSDQGTTWVDINQSLLTQTYIISMDYVNGRLMVEGDNYIFFSTDDGNLWDIDQGTTQFYQIDNFWHRGDTVLASDGIAVFRSTDGGANWSNPQLLQYALVGFDSDGDTVYAGCRGGVYFSTDYGASWTLRYSPDIRYGARYQYNFKISGNNFITGFQEIGPYVSQNRGSTWTQDDLTQFSRASTIDDAMVTYNGTIFTGTHTDGVFKSSDQGNTWTKIGTPTPTDTLSNAVVFAMLHVGHHILLAGTGGDGLYRSADNGATWIRIYNGLPQQAGTGVTGIRSLGISGPNILAATYTGVYYSSDSGLTWHQSTILGGITVLESSGFAVRGNVVCVGIVASPGRGVYRSTDYGVTFSLTDPLLDIICIKEGGGTNMYCGSDFTVSMSIDDGQTWGGVGPGIPAGGGTFTILAWDNYVFVGNNYGVFFSNDNGSSFTDANQGMDPYPHGVVAGLTRDDMYIYAGTDKDAVWRRPLSDFGILPVIMSPLKAHYTEHTGRLSWKTYTEENVSRFEVERSTADNRYNTIGTVSTRGNSHMMLNYAFTDEHPKAGTNYYRLKVIDEDGKYTYSNVASLNADVKGIRIMHVSPNPFTDNLRVAITSEAACELTIQLVDNAGTQLKMKKATVDEGSSVVIFDKLSNVKKGVYYLKITGSDGTDAYKVVK